jgi:hypothetical protein
VASLAETRGFAGVFKGGFEKRGVFWMVFCGEVVVNWVPNVVSLTLIFERQKIRQLFQI